MASSIADSPNHGYITGNFQTYPLPEVLTMFDRYTTHALWDNPAEIPFTLPADAATEEHFLNHDGGIDRIGDIVRPSVTWYPVSGSGPHPAVLVSPGGAYKYLAYNHEGQDICHWFNAIGFSACLLKYRCPDRREAAHADAARAIRWMRFHAAELNISPDRIGDRDSRRLRQPRPVRAEGRPRPVVLEAELPRPHLSRLSRRHAAEPRARVPH